MRFHECLANREAQARAAGKPLARDPSTIKALEDVRQCFAANAGPIIRHVVHDLGLALFGTDTNMSVAICHGIGQEIVDDDIDACPIDRQGWSTPPSVSK